ncbi:unnamed protein product [Haemonchus placei]|uniref:7TM_GPCR_Srx domain-containing protein n=1 Tax=Haemonchus placei TaxID=6290 RepID=A0A0N4WYV5_HAEPC|nr:unnamed protein product [Haemonchus placei]
MRVGNSYFCLQEIAWISAPLLISANVFLHACIRKMELGVLLVSGGIFGFFLLSGISLSISLYIIHSRALGRKQAKYLTPYIFNKLFRIVVLGTLAIVILVSPQLIKTYFYASVYAMFECIAGIVALEVGFFFICSFPIEPLNSEFKGRFRDRVVYILLPST